MQTETYTITINYHKHEDGTLKFIERQVLCENELCYSEKYDPVIEPDHPLTELLEWVHGRRNKTKELKKINQDFQCHCSDLRVYLKKLETYLIRFEAMRKANPSVLEKECHEKFLNILESSLKYQDAPLK